MASKVCKDIPQVVILADDFATNLAPMHDMFPSILMPVVNMPLFDYMIETLSRSYIREVFLYCSSHVELLKKHINDAKYDIMINLIISDDCNCVGDALRDIYAKGWIRGHFILIRGNAFINTNLQILLDTHRLIVEQDKGAVMTLVLRDFGSTHSTALRKETTLVVSARKNNKLLYYEKMNKAEKKMKFPIKWFFEHDLVDFSTSHLDTHIYLCSPPVLSLFADNFDFQTMNDFIRGVLINEEILDSRIYWQRLNAHDYALAITSWKTYHKLNQDVLRRHAYPFVPDASPLINNFIHMLWNTYKHRTATVAKGCVLEKNCILSHDSILGNNTKVTSSVIADHCIVGSNVDICDSYIFSNVKINDNCTITGSIIFPGCIIGTNSKIDGSILCWGTDVPPCSEYMDITAKCTSSGIFVSKMLEDNGNKLLYYTSDEKESNSDSTELSDSEGDSKSIQSALEDTDVFMDEVTDSLLRGYLDKLKCEHLILEINSSRYAYNINVRDVTYNVVKAILHLPCHYLSKMQTPCTLASYRKSFMSVMKDFYVIILNYVKNEEGQDDCLRAIEDAASEIEPLLQCMYEVLYQFYVRDILSEEKIMAWYNHDVGEDGKPQDKIRCAVERFIKWLQEAEEEDSSESSES